MTKNKSSMAADIVGAVREGTKHWTRTVKAEERNPSSRQYRFSRLTRERGVTIKDAAWEIMEQAYMQASGNGQLPANARQIMYAARPRIQEATGRQLEDTYFTQKLLPDYVNENCDQCAEWDVIYDARGHFTEPHTDKSLGIGTLEVRNYLADLNDPSVVDAGFKDAKIETSGPSGNFGAVLFIEKEGFDPILEAAQIADRFDIALMSTKGMSVTAARRLADEMCYEYDVPLLLVHDFDKSGFSIAGTLQRDTRRYEFENEIEVIDLGLSLADVEALELEPEYQFHKKASRSALEANLRLNGADDAEIVFMLRDFDETRSTRRVELNAMTSPQFVEFVERKLTEHGIKKVVPDHDLLAEVYQAFKRGQQLKISIDKLSEEADEKDSEPPEDLEDRIQKILADNPTMRWDAAVAAIVAADNENDTPDVDGGAL